MSLCKRSNCSEFSNEFVHLCLVHYLGTLNTEYNPLLCLVQLSAAGLGSTESHRMQPNGTLVPIVSAASTSVPSVLPPMPTRSLPCLPSLQGKYDRQCPLLQVAHQGGSLVKLFPGFCVLLHEQPTFTAQTGPSYRQEQIDIHMLLSPLHMTTLPAQWFSG